MLRVFRFLLLLAAQKYWGEVRIRFKEGQVVGQIKAEQEWLIDTLPQPGPGTVAAGIVAAFEQANPEVMRAAIDGKGVS